MNTRESLDLKLRAVRARWVRRDAALCAARIILVLLPAMLVLGWWDYRVGFSRSMRTVELGGLIALAVWSGRRWVAPMLRQSRTAFTSALCVESVFAEFAGRLASRVQFRSAPSAPAGAPALLEAACTRIEAQSAGLSLHDAIDMRPLRKPAAMACVVLLLAAGIVAAQPRLAGLWLLRTLLPFSDIAWPKRSHIARLPASYRVRRGDALTVQGRISGEIPRAGRLNWRTADAGLVEADRTADFDITPNGAFQAGIGPLLEPITLSVAAGDARTTNVKVEVVRPPELAGIEAVYHYPEYTHRQPDRVQSGDIRALVGTRVELTLTADRPTRRMELSFPGEPAEKSLPVRLASDTQGTAGFTIRSRGRYQIRLYDRFDFTSNEPATFIIDPVDDELPTIKLNRPGADHRVTPATRLHLEFEAADDYGIVAARIVWHKREEPASQPTTRTAGILPAPGPNAAINPSDSRRQDAGGTSRLEACGTRVTIPVGPPRTRWTGTFTWDLATANLLPGDEVDYHLEVQDAGEHLTAEKVGRSSGYLLKVVDADTLAQALETQLREAFGELDDVIRQQTAGLNEVSAAIVSLPTRDEPVVSSDVQRIGAEQSRQTRLARQVGRIGERIRQTVDDLRDSFLADAPRIASLRQVADELGKLAGGKMESAAEALRRSQETLRQLSVPR